MAYRTRVFIDFWNFSLNWKERADSALIDWTTVPRVLVDEGQKKLEAVGITESTLSGRVGRRSSSMPSYR